MKRKHPNWSESADKLILSYLDKPMDKQEANKLAKTISEEMGVDIQGVQVKSRLVYFRKRRKSHIRSLREVSTMNSPRRKENDALMNAVYAVEAIDAMDKAKESAMWDKARKDFIEDMTKPKEDSIFVEDNYETLELIRAMEESAVKHTNIAVGLTLLAVIVMLVGVVLL